MTYTNDLKTKRLLYYQRLFLSWLELHVTYSKMGEIWFETHVAHYFPYDVFCVLTSTTKKLTVI